MHMHMHIHRYTHSRKHTHMHVHTQMRIHKHIHMHALAHTMHIHLHVLVHAHIWVVHALQICAALLKKIENDEAQRSKEMVDDEELGRKDAPLDSLLSKLQGSIRPKPIKVTGDEGDLAVGRQLLKHCCTVGPVVDRILALPLCKAGVRAWYWHSLSIVILMH